MQFSKRPIVCNGPRAERDAQAQWDVVKKPLARGQAKATAARADAAKWSENGKATADKTIAGWKSKGASAKLKGRAHRAERSAAAALEIAVAAVDEAKQAALEASLARQDAERAPGK